MSRKRPSPMLFDMSDFESELFRDSAFSDSSGTDDFLHDLLDGPQSAPPFNDIESILNDADLSCDSAWAEKAPIHVSVSDHGYTTVSDHHCTSIAGPVTEFTQHIVEKNNNTIQHILENSPIHHVAENNTVEHMPEVEDVQDVAPSVIRSRTHNKDEVIICDDQWPENDVIRQAKWLSRNIPLMGQLVLSTIEAEAMRAEGIDVPTQLPLTQIQRSALRLARRKLKNKISAMESRKKKRKYMDTLETQVEEFASENGDLRNRVGMLEKANLVMSKQLQQLQTVVSGLVQQKAPGFLLVVCLVVSLVVPQPSQLTSLSYGASGVSRGASWRPSQRSMVLEDCLPEDYYGPYVPTVQDRHGGLRQCLPPDEVLRDAAVMYGPYLELIVTGNNTLDKHLIQRALQLRNFTR